jgi:hypothetical protein
MTCSFSCVALSVDEPASQDEWRPDVYLTPRVRNATNSGGPLWDATGDGSEHSIPTVFQHEVDI